MVRLEDVALANHQDKYTIKCAAAGMEVIVPRTKAHATAIYVWNGNIVPNLYNVYPMFAGATPIDSWQGICRGAPCTFWMTDNADGNVACTQNLEPNGDNSVNYRIYKNNDGCGVEGGWNDADALVEYAGWVICSTNDC
ncbi:hypothetical protein [Nannocystis sp.]|uniref:hypothetical protein n=1 Tax=Nannocystis sp. TaxID=1962667 RepID=UPI0025CC40F2|nr:hypothetical protein [Nannocystis sp.]MBK7827371.1 hypothetical protein [Nannocystis sp.]